MLQIKDYLFNWHQIKYIKQFKNVLKEECIKIRFIDRRVITIRDATLKDIINLERRNKNVFNNN